MFLASRASRACFTGATRFRPSTIPRLYSNVPVPKKLGRGAPIKTIVLVTVISFALLDLTTRLMDKKSDNKKSFTEKEYEEAIKAGLKRKTRMFKTKELPGGVFLCPPPPASVTSAATFDARVDALQKQLGARVIDLEALIAEQRADADSRYGLLLDNLAAQGDSAVYPPGLFPALIGMEFKSIRRQLIAEAGEEATEISYPTPIIVKNFPRTVENATKFEEDIAFASKLVVFGKVDTENEKFIEDQQLREYSQLAGYFEIVDKLFFVEEVDGSVVERLRQ
ncbi:hypothetical protein BABINDRAFT_162008 [Babjeviella inositovora NRRL Y-12698]|uniref:Altered inheritance of mitochondria protein 36, mitochondrial n=1 Tax=Babjeviella inositovora NRRL Y-12698 TaxID=984486 RepID=A0A1E3QPR0_9ASCO|nr:uncharacterized protein BABINDRAFT_162008 [Babjeviella inositovora NRRL Y-12698]ODQ79628.1 hypothetical protein BABINDRAFT_162008 [Babjeviella inositovora NRRL Y-12698]